ncbi:MAG: alpha-amylase family protein [Thermoleophilia bacterium]
MSAWYEDTVVYALDVERFRDGEGNGIGDFEGLVEQLGHVAALGANCVWLLPFYPTPNRDNGYDIQDFYGVDPRLGSPGDFVEFMEEADRLGLRVIVDLVMSHTSDQHPWFQQARRDPESRYRNYYLWSDEPVGGEDKLIVTGQEDGPWTWDEEAGMYYFHRFYSFQPDLDNAHPDVRGELDKLVSFWCRLGAAGVRVDAATYLVDKAGHGFLREMRSAAQHYHGDPLLLGETDVAAERLDAFFGEGDELNCLFNFLCNNYLFLALARGEAEPLERGLRMLPNPPPGCAWGNFLRNHDELNLDQLTEQERAEVLATFAPDADMRVFGGKGIRRRLAPMLGGDPRRLALAYSLLFAFPGIPVLRYGEEIGMGDDLSLHGRGAVRTPMQWTREANAGFSSAAPERLVEPVISGGPYGFEQINVADQERDPDSLLNLVRALAWARRRLRAIGSRRWDIVDVGDPGVLALRYPGDEDTVLTLHNLSGSEASVELSRALQGSGPPIDVVGDHNYEPLADASEACVLPASGYRWLRSSTEQGAP